jgi:hypothetical protein
VEPVDGTHHLQHQLVTPATARVAAPDLAAPIVGWRLWLVVADGGYLWLESVLRNVRWSPLRPLRAVCVPHHRPDAAGGHAAPRLDCDCGIYAARTPEPLASYLDSAFPGRPTVARALGRVRLWGEVIECERGWRGELAYPDALFIPTRESIPAHQVTAGLRDYGVETALLDRRFRLEILTAINDSG